ncbi:MAG: glycoside hydrolase family 88 protein [Candidatus Cryptobacteroides sp.]|jgi:unsaturated chondroitin disaccharide hydrolase
MMKKGYWLVGIVLCLSVFVQGCSFSVQKSIDYCASQATKTLAMIPSVEELPSSIPADSSRWVYTSPGVWTCGFWPGILWYLFEGTGDSKWEAEARKVTEEILPVAYRKAKSHDVGFMIMTSIGNAYRITGEEKYLHALVAAADSLIRLYNPVVGTILSWPNMVEQKGWQHNTIVDNMINLELLFWVAQHENRKDLFDIAFRHAEVTMAHQFRSDHSTYHVMVFNPEDGRFVKGYTHQGWKDSSTWARGQAWAVYGFTMAYRFTHDQRFLDTAVDAADYFIRRLPEDQIPFWDFDAGESLTDQPKDCSAAAIVASALLELQLYLPGKLGNNYKKQAIKMLGTMSKAPYRAGSQCPAFLLYSTGHMPNGREVNASISYADYYYLEALTRLRRLQ